MSKMKLCINCVHHHQRSGFAQHLCKRDLDTEIDLVTGEVLSNNLFYNCKMERKMTNTLKGCGPDGFHYEEAL